MLRRIIVLVISIVLLVSAFLFLYNINKGLEDTIMPDGEAKFTYEQVSSINVPSKETMVINTLQELKSIVLEHNFNTKHSYIYIRINTDNKHTYSITNVIKSGNIITCMINISETPENINIEKVDEFKEYIIDIEGIINHESQIVINTNSDAGGGE